jgi:hypothetical protein
MLPLLLVAEEANRLLSLRIAKDLATEAMEQTGRYQFVNRTAFLIRGGELDQRRRPQRTLIQPVGHILGNARITDTMETADVLRIVARDSVQEMEGIHREFTPASSCSGPLVTA